jgi:hypothetical protein
MAFEGVQTAIPGLFAGADLRLHQFKFVKLNAAKQVVLCAAITDDPIGILQDTPNTGQAANVCAHGVSKLSSNVALTAGALVGTSVDGQGAVAIATMRAVGRVLEATANADEIATVFVNCPGSLVA